MTSIFLYSQKKALHLEFMLSKLAEKCVIDGDSLLWVMGSTCSGQVGSVS
jgi:hypothetical protein